MSNNQSHSSSPLIARISSIADESNSIEAVPHAAAIKPRAKNKKAKTLHTSASGSSCAISEQAEFNLGGAATSSTLNQTGNGGCSADLHAEFDPLSSSLRELPTGGGHVRVSQGKPSKFQPAVIVDKSIVDQDDVDVEMPDLAADTSLSSTIARTESNLIHVDGAGMQTQTACGIYNCLSSLMFSLQRFPYCNTMHAIDLIAVVLFFVVASVVYQSMASNLRSNHRPRLVKSRCQSFLHQR